MRNASIFVKRAAIAATMVGGLVAGLTVRLPDTAMRAHAAVPHPAMAGHEGHHPAAQRVAAAPDEVVIDNFTFGPATLTVPVGTKVTWTNKDSDPHTVTSEADPKLLKSGPLDTGDSFAYVFDKPGTYRYYCSIHPHMEGTIVVQ